MSEKTPDEQLRDAIEQVAYCLWAVGGEEALVRFGLAVSQQGRRAIAHAYGNRRLFSRPPFAKEGEETLQTSFGDVRILTEPWEPSASFSPSPSPSR